MKVGFFQEKEGENSAARLIFVIGSIWSMLMSTFFGAVKDFSPAEVLAFISGTIGVFAAIKLGQKSMEKRSQQ